MSRISEMVIVFRTPINCVAQSQFNRFNPFSASIDAVEEHNRQVSHSIDVVCDACEALSISKTGALIVRKSFLDFAKRFIRLF